LSQLPPAYIVHPSIGTPSSPESDKECDEQEQELYDQEKAEEEEDMEEMTGDDIGIGRDMEGEAGEGAEEIEVGKGEGEGRDWTQQNGGAEHDPREEADTPTPSISEQGICDLESLFVTILTNFFPLTSM